MTGTKGMLHYSPKLKLEAVKLFLEERCSYREIAEQLGIRKKERIEMWVMEFRRIGTEAFTKPIGRPRKGTETKG